MKKTKKQTLRSLRRECPDIYRWPTERFIEDLGYVPGGVWYRSPSWEDHTVWNKNHGFVDYLSIRSANLEYIHVVYGFRYKGLRKIVRHEVDTGINPLVINNGDSHTLTHTATFEVD